MAKYQGHRSWNAWNVALWIGNDEYLYRLAIECINAAQKKYQGRHPLLVIPSAAGRFMRESGLTRTPDGAVFNRVSVQDALAGLME